MCVCIPLLLRPATHVSAQLTNCHSPLRHHPVSPPYLSSSPTPPPPPKHNLQRHGLPPSGPLFKSVSGELSNLRWDLPLKEYPSFWEKENRCVQGKQKVMGMHFTRVHAWVCE